MGRRRIQGELPQLGIAMAPSTVWDILHAAGIDPAPRPRRPDLAAVPHGSGRDADIPPHHCDRYRDTTDPRNPVLNGLINEYAHTPHDARKTCSSPAESYFRAE